MDTSALMVTRCPTCFGEIVAGHACARCRPHGQPRPSPLALASGTVLNGHYRIGQVLGQPGGFGITYLAWDERLETRVAVKEFFPRELAGRGSDRATLHPHSESDAPLFEYGLQQFLAEARRLARFDHANIVRVRTFFEANGTGYLVMDYYEGQSLSAFLARQPGERLGERLAVEIMMPVLDGLRAVHAQGVLHRDIDPHNIYLTTQGRVILLDFGAARTAMGDKSRSLSVILKPGYAPYEQYASTGKQGAWTDVYACAATLYRMLTGQVPVDALSRIMGDTLRPAHELNPALSPRLGEALERALAVRPEERPQTAQEFQELLMVVEPPRAERSRTEVPWTENRRKLTEIAASRRVRGKRRGALPRRREHPLPVRAPALTAPSAERQELAESLAMLSPELRSHLERRGYRPTRRLLHEDFSDNRRGWLAQDQPRGNSFVLRNGRAYMMTRQRGQTFETGLRVPHRDVAIRFDLRYESEGEDYGAGLVFRRDDGRGGIAVLVTAARAARYYRVASHDPTRPSGQEWVDLVGWTRADALIRPAENTVELLVAGRDLSLFLNGTFVHAVPELPTTAGEWIRFHVRSANLQYSFDDLVVVEVESQ